MDIQEPAMAGTLESSDCQVMIQPNDDLVIEIESSVLEQYGQQIEATIRETLENLKVSQAYIRVNDQGALDCTIKARIATAVLRSRDITEDIDWKGLMTHAN